MGVGARADKPAGRDIFETRSSLKPVKGLVDVGFSLSQVTTVHLPAVTMAGDLKDDMSCSLSEIV